MAEAPIVGALLLAAGAGTRMGGVKPARPFRGRPMLAWGVDAARAAGLPLLLVTGANRAAVEAAAGAVPSIHAENWADGLSASLRAGLLAAPAGWAGVLVLLADMPLVRPATLAALAAALRLGAPAVVPVHGGRRGNPCGFARGAFPRLLALSGDRGARALLGPLGAVEVAVDDPGILADFDRPEDLAGK